MRKLILAFIACIVFAGCTTIGKKYENDGSPSRIVIKESRVIDGMVLYIIEVDSIEFIYSYRGGIAKIK